MGLRGVVRSGWYLMVLHLACAILAAYGYGMPRSIADPVVEAVAVGLQLPASEVAGHLDILALPAALPRDAGFRFVSVKAAAQPGMFLLKLACRDRGCLPFYAILHSSAGELASSSPARSIGVGMVSRSGRNAPLQRAGDRVQVVEELSGLRLRTPAVCLQPGSLGDRIRVRTTTTHRVLLATIADKNLVRVER